MQLPPQRESLTPRCPPRRTYNLSASNGNQTARVILNPGLFQREGIGVVSQLQNNNNSAGAIPIRIKMLLMLGRRTSLRIRHHPQGWKRGCLSVSLRFFILFASLFFFVFVVLRALLQMDMKCYTNKKGAGWPCGSRKRRARVQTEHQKQKQDGTKTQKKIAGPDHHAQDTERTTQPGTRRKQRAQL